MKIYKIHSSIFAYKTIDSKLNNIYCDFDKNNKRNIKKKKLIILLLLINLF